MEHDANPPVTDQSNDQAFFDLARDISNKTMSDPDPINRAYLGNLIIGRDFRDLTGLYDTYRDPAKSRSFDYAVSAFNARFADPASPNGVSPAAMNLFPSFMMDLDGAVRAQNLNPTQIRDLTNNMLDDTQKLYLASNAPSPQPETAADVGSAEPAPAPTSGSPDAATNNPPADDTNTSTNTNADSNVVDSNGKPDQVDTEQDSGNKAEAASDASPQLKNPFSQAIVDKARGYVGSTDWAYKTAKENFGAGKYKCNLFVYDVLTEAGAQVPLINSGRWSGERYPPVAAQWADPNLSIPGFEIVPKDQAQPGDVVAIPHLYIPGLTPTGHVGIVTGPGKTTSVITRDEKGNPAVPEIVRENDWGFRQGDDAVFRRYTGNIQNRPPAGSSGQASQFN
jgi:hypothetical protein